MNYPQSLRYLNSFLNLERITYKPTPRFWNLKRMSSLLEWTRHPENCFFPILIAGTKGKGSTGFFLESILRSNGIQTGFYSSPHLEDPRERIRIGARNVSKEAWAEGLGFIRRTLHQHKLAEPWGDFTYFEILTWLAIWLFSRTKVRVGIFEIGMGGRLDATNCLDAKLSVLTPIHFDHEAFLGNTLAKIAGEKAAIIRRGADVVISPQPKEVLAVIRKELCRKNAKGWLVKPLRGVTLGLQGEHQRVNAGAALQAAKLLNRYDGFKLDPLKTKTSLRLNGWPGRLELFEGKPAFLLDAAHNPSSITALVRYLKKTYIRRSSLVIFGIAKDKKLELIFKQLGNFFREIILTPLPNPRSQEMGVLLKNARKHFKRIYPTSSIREALALARARSSKRGLVVATGSFYLIGEIRGLLKKEMIS